ncbi:MAG: acyltransferase [Gammaproteobacteria bacterium]|nr:acyltransferase [Gammaproteobacteria bacterium]MBU1553404.1 acyltransferase [Gammaproteobacteria bacterium]MBU2069441.1 acyltransferase [Gammaproteobacteria bacterium]MBU2182945.1 acyltransferase [Gammaproteobacteria bacterium]MBU2203293.1 acyltransferase [Gammaproteobacteria bacterium]
MLSFLPGWLLLPFSFSLFALNLALWGLLVTPLGIVKLLLPFSAVHRLTGFAGKGCYRGWTRVNTALINLFNAVDWQISGAQTLDKASWYLLISNHKSWLDIPVVSTVAHSRIPEPKFFLKDELKWLPFLGTGCWALDMPFMKRYSAAQLAKRPELQGKDIETTRASCQKFKTVPTTIINFVEGTRCTEQKKAQKRSPFHYLLPPKAGGIAFTLASMGEQFNAILDFTLLYPDNPHHVALDMLTGKLKRVVVQVEVLPVDQQVIGDYFNDEQFRQRFQLWLNQRWQEKDQRIAQYYLADAADPITEQVSC